MLKAPWFTGLIFGVLVYLFMNRVVLPLSALSSKPPLQLLGLLVHMCLVGLPIVLAARRFAR